MAAFLTGRLSAAEFEQRYLRLFLGDESMRSEPVYQILNRLFADVDAFCPDPTIRGAYDIDEPQLRSSVAAALDALGRETRITPVAG